MTPDRIRLRIPRVDFKVFFVEHMSEHHGIIGWDGADIDLLNLHDEKHADELAARGRPKLEPCDCGTHLRPSTSEAG